LQTIERQVTTLARLEAAEPRATSPKTKAERKTPRMGFISEVW